MGSTEPNPSNHHAIIFDRAYKQTKDMDMTNTVACPQHDSLAGIYFFTRTIYSGGNGVTKFYIYVNNDVLGQTFRDTHGIPNYNSDSWSLVVYLNAYDSVYIRSGMDSTTSFISSINFGFSTFAGGKHF